MSWYSKVVWSEGLFLRPHHLQQTDRYLEHLVENRTRHASPYPWVKPASELSQGSSAAAEELPPIRDHRDRPRMALRFLSWRTAASISADR